MAEKFPHLFSPIQIGSVMVRNRIVNTAHGTNFAQDRLVTDRHIHYHVERSANEPSSAKSPSEGETEICSRARSVT